MLKESVGKWMKQASKLHTDLILLKISDDMTGVPVTESEYIDFSLVLVELEKVIFQGNRVAPRLFVPVITLVVTGIF